MVGKCEVVGKGKIIATIYVRGHMVSVKINYNTNVYSIHYNKSYNMGYNSASKSINRYYNSWVARLNQRIQAQLALTN